MSVPGATPPGQPAIVGRDAELAEIASFMARPAGGAAAMLIRGEAGMGKTTLWEHAVREARDRGDHVVLAQPTESERRLSFAALADLLRDLSPQSQSSIPEPQRHALDAALRRATGPADPLAVAMGFVSYLIGPAGSSDGTGQVLVAVDDVHWLDAPSARVLEFAFRRAADHGVTFLLAVRSGEPAPILDALARALPDERTTAVELGPLSLGALHRLFAVRLGHAFARPTLVRLHDASGANPFVALEIARALIESGEPVVAGAPLPVPASLRQLLQRRIVSLPRPTREALLALSGLADADEEKLARALDHSSVDAVLGPAEASGIVIRERGRIRFSHPLMAAAVYASVSPARIGELHRRLAQVTTDLEERARHLARSAAPPDAGIASTLEDAGDRARQRGAPEAGAELLALARDFTPRSDEEAWTRRLLAAGEAMFEAADTAAATSVLESAIAEMPAGRGRAKARLLLATVRWYVDIPAAMRLAEAALTDAEGDPTLQGQIHTRLSLFATNAGEATAHRDAAVRLIDPAEDPSLLAFALFGSFYGAVSGGQTPQMELFERALHLEPERPTWEVSTIPALWWKYTDRYGPARDRLQLHLRWARETGDASSDADLFAHLAELELWAGDWASAEQYADQSVDAADQMGLPFANSSHRVQALVRAHLGRTADARTAARAGQLASAADDDVVLSAMYLTVLGFAALSDDDPAAAHEDFVALEAELDKIQEAEPMRFRWEPDHLEALLLLGDLAGAEEVLAGLERRHRGLPRPWTAVATPRCAALVLAARGDLDAALAASGTALAELASLPSPFEHGRTILVHGQLLRRANQRRAAADTLGQALAIFQQLRAPLWARRAREEAARLGLRRDAGSALTPSEREVARLAAAGMTNRQVADALFISPKTVEANLGRAYSKLGIHSRAELGRVMADEPSGERGVAPTHS